MKKTQITRREISGGSNPDYRTDLLPNSTHRLVSGLRNDRGRLLARQRKRIALTTTPQTGNFFS